MSIETYGRYQLLKKLATGGMAQIYLARQSGPEGFEKLLVVKRILPHLAENEEFITMFLDEARIAARLNHPNVVQIFDLGAQDDSFFIAMEYIHGEDVRRVWKHTEKQGEAVPVALICRILIEACAGLDYAHKKADPSGRPLGIVHRDISPQNILVSFEGGVKIVDFGIAKAADQATVTKSGVLKGKYSYMSPEQASGQPIDSRTDIFALGVVMYELLTGTRLFKKPTDIQTLNAVTECKIVRPSEVNRRVPVDLETIVMKALARDRTQRFSEARQFGAALEDWLLSNKLPASSANLAEFMQRIYADRLAREQEEGRLLVDTTDSSRGEEPEKATPAFDKVSRPTRSLRASKSQRELEATSAERPASKSQSVSRRSIDRPPPTGTRVREATEASLATQSNTRPKWPFALAGLSLLVLLASIAFVMTRPAPKAGFSLDSTPRGATVSIGGQTVCTTPCQLDDLESGQRELVIALEGFATERRQISLKAGIHEAMPLIPLQAMSAVSIDAGVAAPVESTVEVSFTTEPAGARVVVDGEGLGITPFSARLTPGESMKLEVELTGFTTIEETLVVGNRPSEAHQWALKPAAKNSRPQITRPQPPEKDHGQVQQPSGTARGTVRFVMTRGSAAYADIDCPRLNFKDQTPTGDQSFPVGEYSCTFSNPEFAPKTMTVRVTANETNKVLVTLTH